MAGLRTSTFHTPRRPLKLSVRPLRRDTDTVTTKRRRAEVTQTNTCSVARSLRNSTTVAHHHLQANTTTEAGSSSNREDPVDTDKVHRQDRTASHLQGHRMGIRHQEDLRLRVVTGADHLQRRLAVTPVGIQVKATDLAADKDLMGSSNHMDNSRMVSNHTVKTLMGKVHTGKVLLDSPGTTAIHLAID